MPNNILLSNDGKIVLYNNYPVMQPITKLYLYNEGDDCADITGGWDIYQSDSYGYYQKLTMNSTNMYYDGNPYGSNRGPATKNKIDLSGYSKLYVDFSYNITDTWSVADSRIQVIASPALISGSVSIPGILNKGVSSMTRTIKSVNLNVNTSYHFAVSCGFTSKYNITIYKIWTEK